MIDCIYWRPHPLPGFGICVGGFKPNPSAGSCGRCEDRVPETHSPFVQLVVCRKRVPKKRKIELVGPAMWQELHLRALGPLRGDEVEWLRLFTLRLPCGSCRKWLEANPPDLTSAEAFFTWTVEWHNEVNKKLGKAQQSSDKARKFWTGVRDKSIVGL